MRDESIADVSTNIASILVEAVGSSSIGESGMGFIEVSLEIVGLWERNSRRKRFGKENSTWELVEKGVRM